MKKAMREKVKLFTVILGEFDREVIEKISAKFWYTQPFFQRLFVL